MARYRRVLDWQRVFAIRERCRLDRLGSVRHENAKKQI